LRLRSYIQILHNMIHEHKKPSAGRSPVSVRLTPEERLELEKAAGGMSLSQYIRSRIFLDDTVENQNCSEERISPAARQKLLAQILSSLGKSGTATALSELAELARLGLLPDDADIVPTLAQAHDEATKLRSDLLRALGLRPKSGGRK